MGRKVSREVAITALVSNPNIKEAAAKCGISEKTLHRWLNEPDFAVQLAEAQRGVTRRVMRSVISRTERAVEVLDDVMTDITNAAHARVSAAKTVLEFSMKAIEIEEILDRLEKLEITANDNK